MRSIKFRIWNNLDKVMLRDNQADLVLFLDGGIYSRFDKEFVSKENFILQQFTGLLDKNGKEIYEGDILSWQHLQIANDLNPLEVIYHPPCFTVKNHFYPYCEWENSKVIGNVFENPDIKIRNY